MKFILLLSFLLLASCSWNGKLMFNEENSFTILQVTDLHFGENQIEDFRSMGIQYQLINEIKPDLVVMSGDMTSGYTDHCHQAVLEQDCYKHGWQKYTFALKSLKQKYAIILGNHDGLADLTRKQVIDLDMTSSESLTQQSPEGVSEGSNYYLPIYDQEGESVQSLIWMFDSHNQGCNGNPDSWGCVEKDQIDWFNREYQNQLQTNNKSTIESVAFVHIPPSEFVKMFNEQETYGNAAEDTSCPCENSNTGFVDAMMQNNVQASYSGHDHNNDYGGFYHKDGKKIELQYGRKSGFGSYGPPKGVTRGAQVITLKPDGNGKIVVESYIQDQLGHKIFKGKAKKNDKKMKECPPLTIN